MKTFLCIILLTVGKLALSQQCPPTVLKIQSPICDTPKNLNASNIKCATAQLNWQGSKEQKYIVTATGIDNAGNVIFKTDSAKYACDESGNCAAIINVKEGA